MVVMPREGGTSSTPRLIDSITEASGILDRPPSRTMTTEYEATISRRIAPEVCYRLPALLENRGRREDRVLAAPAVSRANAHGKRRHTSIQGSWSIPAFPAQWLYGLLRALPGERLFCHRRSTGEPVKLSASTAAPEPHDFAVRF